MSQYKINSAIKSLTKSPKQDLVINSKSNIYDHDFLAKLKLNLDNLNYPYIPIYLMLSSDITLDIELFFDYIVNEIFTNLVKKNIITENIFRINEMRSWDFIDNVKTIINFAYKNSPELRIILMIDNINYLFQFTQKNSSSFVKRAFNHLNSLLQSEIGNNLSAVVKINPDLNNSSSPLHSSMFSNYRFVQL